MIPKRRFKKKNKIWEIALGDDDDLERYVAAVSKKLWEGWVEEIAPGKPSPRMPEIQPTSLDAQREHLRTLFADFPAIESFTKPALQFRLRKMHEDDFALGQSRFGGCPDLPPKTMWPVFIEKKPKRERPLAFVAQLRLEDFAPKDASKLLPKSGLLSFFVLADWDDASPTEPDYLSICRVLYTPTKEKLERRSDPPARYVAHAIEAFPIFTFPPPDGRAFKKLRLKGADYQRFADAKDAYVTWLHHRLPGIRGTQLLGYRSRTDDREPKQILLLQCETDYSVGMRWGDADSVYFWIDPKALAKSKFDGVTSNYAD